MGFAAISLSKFNGTSVSTHAVSVNSNFIVLDVTPKAYEKKSLSGVPKILFKLQAAH